MGYEPFIEKHFCAFYNKKRKIHTQSKAYQYREVLNMGIKSGWSGEPIPTDGNASPKIGNWEWAVGWTPSTHERERIRQNIMNF